MSNLLYDALMLGRNKKLENEEFLVAIGKKDAASFQIEEESIHISNVIEDGVFSVHLTLPVPGYLEILVSCDDSFLSLDRTLIHSEEFTDGKFDFHFLVLSDQLHNGRNYTAIHFRSPYQELQVPVYIENRIRVRFTEGNPKSREISLLRYFLRYQTDRMEQWEWAQKSLELLGEIPGGDDVSLYLMLYKAQIYMTRGDDAHARNYIEHVGTQIPKLEKKNYDLYCYFIYLASLYEEMPGVHDFALPEEFQDSDPAGLVDDFPELSRDRLSDGGNIMDLSALQKVRWVYAHYPSWGILRILFYMDPSFQGNGGRRLKLMQDFFYQGESTSPLLYLESLRIYRNRPERMQELGPFELQVMNFAVKYEYLTPRIADRAAQLVLEKKYNRFSASDRALAERIFIYAYARFSGGSILKALCFLLSAQEKKSQGQHEYFDRAVQNGFMDGEILCAFIETLDDTKMDPLPDAVMNYFLEHTELLYDHKSYVYANIIANKYAQPELYNENLRAIIQYAEQQVMQGQNDRLLAILYQEILDNHLATRNMKNNLFDVICTREVQCSHDHMRSVMVFHKELQVYQESVLRNGRAYIRVYDSDALILFQDTNGNMYHHVEYQVHPLMETREYIDQCMREADITKYMLIGSNFPLLRACKPALDILEYFTSRRFQGQFRKNYEQELLRNIVSYYAKNSRDERVYDELLKLREYDLPLPTRGLLIGILLRRELIEEAFQEIGTYGTCGLDGKTLAELAHAYIARHGTVKNEILTRLCEAGYGENGFDEYLFDYLYQHYDGKMELLVELYRSSNAYHRPSEVIEERILRRSILTGEHPEVVNTVFQRYYEKNLDRDLTKAYMEYRAGVYLYALMTQTPPKEETADLSFFTVMENEMMRGILYSDDSIAAYLLYRTQLEHPSERQLRNLELQLKDLVRRGKMLEEFKYYKKYFALPSTLTNNIIISAFSDDPAKKPLISFEITGPVETIQGSEEMEEIFQNCYVKYFTLFYGEKVVFSMDGQASTQARYSDLDIRRDGSRYAALDDMIRLKAQGQQQELIRAARDFYLKQRMSEILF